MELQEAKSVSDNHVPLPCPAAGKPCIHRVTRQTCSLLEGIEKDLECSIGAIVGLRGRLLLYTRLFRLNEVELAAWAWVLSKTMRSTDPSCIHLLNLSLGAYHVKTIMCEDVARFREVCSGEDSSFPDNYTYWLRVNPAIRQLSLEELNRKHKKLMLDVNVSNPISTYTTIVEALVEAKTPAVAPTTRLFSEPNSGCFVYEREDLDEQNRSRVPDISNLFVKPDFEAVEKIFHRDFYAPSSVFK